MKDLVGACSFECDATPDMTPKSNGSFSSSSSLVTVSDQCYIQQRPKSEIHQDGLEGEVYDNDAASDLNVKGAPHQNLAGVEAPRPLRWCEWLSDDSDDDTEEDYVTTPPCSVAEVATPVVPPVPSCVSQQLAPIDEETPPPTYLLSNWPEELGSVEELGICGIYQDLLESQMLQQWPFSAKCSWATPSKMEQLLTCDPEPLINLQELSLQAAGVAVPKFDTRLLKGSEDAHIIIGHQDGQSPIRGMICIADGVGGVWTRGFDPKLYPRNLMNCAYTCFQNLTDEEVNQSCEAVVATVLAHAYQMTLGAPIFGACTAVFVGLKKGQLGVINLGDSGCRLLRREGSSGFRRTVGTTVPQQSTWNCPYQLCRFPDEFEVSSRPDDANHYLWDVLPGDLVVVATDGAFDNLWDEEIECITTMMLSPQEKAQLEGGTAAEHAESQAGLAAQVLVDCVVSVSRQRYRHTPWAAAHLNLISGGKVDDITVVAAWIV